MKIGVIAEEDNDIDVLYGFTCKLIDEKSFSIKKFVGHGGGKVRSKCTAWADDLIRRGCTYLVVLHDLDERVLSVLSKELSDSIAHASYNATIILIPVREMEAWLLTDPRALKKVFGLSKEPKLPGNPETLLDPKKRLTEIIWKGGKKRYINTIHNKKIAMAMSIAKAKTCKSFCPYPIFVSKHLKKKKTGQRKKKGR